MTAHTPCSCIDEAIGAIVDLWLHYREGGHDADRLAFGLRAYGCCVAQECGAHWLAVVRGGAIRALADTRWPGTGRLLGIAINCAFREIDGWNPHLRLRASNTAAA